MRYIVSLLMVLSLLVFIVNMIPKKKELEVKNCPRLSCEHVFKILFSLMIDVGGL